MTIPAALLATFDRLAASGERVAFWLRDDDAFEPTPALDRLLQTMQGQPLTLAVIPDRTGAALAQRLAGRAEVSIAVHGWSHSNHAPAGEKSQELGAHRPLPQIHGELGRGFQKLAGLFPQQFLPLLVPPWNRIAPEVTAGLSGLGFRALSLFGADKPSPIALCNTHLDIIDWRGTRGGREEADLWADLEAQIAAGRRTVGVLTHHLVHDAAAWRFLDRLVPLVLDHPACRWHSVRQLVALGT